MKLGRIISVVIILIILSGLVLGTSCDCILLKISDIIVSDITENAATITWTTNRQATSNIEYGLTTSYGSSSPTTADTTADKYSHSIRLRRLSPNTTYHYCVKSKDADNTGAISSDQTFTTADTADTTAPIISGITVSGITENAATITWTTDESATSNLEYGLTTSYGFCAPLIILDTTTDKTSHSLILSDLSSNTTYHFRVRSRDADGNEAISVDKTFTTIDTVPIYTYQIVNRYPHDISAFTQGLVFEDGVIYEGTGLYGKSSLRKVELETGYVLQLHQLPAQYFGEGVTVFKDSIVQLTWKSNLGFVYDKRSLELLSDFSYSTKGWGITNNGERFIMSDGTSNLYFLEPETFNIIGHINVYNNDIPVNNINELEYINGQIYANIWPTDNIAIINPYNGQVSGWVDLSGLLQSQDYNIPANVLNGIAYDTLNNRLFVTGKLWPWLFEIELVVKE